MEAWVVVGLLVLAALVVAGLAYWYYQKGKAPPTPSPFGPVGPQALADVDYFHSGSYFTLGYFTDHYFTIAGSGTPPVVVTVPPNLHIRNHYYYSGGG